MQKVIWIRVRPILLWIFWGTKPKVKAVAQNEDIQPKEAFDSSEIVEAFKHFRKEIKEEIRQLKNAVYQSIESSSRASSRPERCVSVFIKTPLVDNLDEFDCLEANLTEPDFKQQMIEELIRFKGNCVQSSLSHMITYDSKSTLKAYSATRGSKGQIKMTSQRELSKTLLVLR